MDGFSVIMPTYNQCSFIRRAIKSLCVQSYKKWELIIIDDGSTDKTGDYITDYLMSSEYNNISYIRNNVNKGMAAAINQALDAATFDYITYLPSDDFYYENHLQSFKEKFDESDEIILVFSGFRFDESHSPGMVIHKNINGIRPNYCLQLVQTAHKKTKDRWIERKEYVSEDLFFTFWSKLTDKGIFVPTKKITCEWSNHPNQRHKIAGEKYCGGINKYRKFYAIQEPIKMRTTSYKTIDENILYQSYRKKHQLVDDYLKILLVGDLAYNSERIYAFEEAGHKLYGLWANPVFCYSTIGHLPFGHVEDISYENWKAQVKEISPDIIYGQISTGAISIAHEVLKAATGIPFVWHFKESPHEAMKAGLWNQLIELYTYADGKIYLSEETKKWFELFTPDILNSESLIMDPEMAKINCFTNDFSNKLSEIDGEIHTVIIGRIIGLSPQDILLLSKNNIHIHVYHENYVPNEGLIDLFRNIASKHFHIHPHCSQSNWVKEFSQYDAGWLHCFDSDNNKNLMKQTWSELNIPARISTLVAAGLPIIQKDNSEHIVAMHNYIKDVNIGVFFKKIEDLVLQLKNKDLLYQLRSNIITQRFKFSYDYHVPRLIDFFKQIITKKINQKNTL
ncbi:MAG: glycosyltransferase [Bacteroidales bacterium]|jgi:glycosyltransferase involved in cell wall biosynthesis|nr:glycosyltransferase [Bacteroidales bacterium]